jgi:hypothetical protein
MQPVDIVDVDATRRRRASRHASTQLSVNPPLRKIISSFIDNLDVDYELLECGHTIRSPLDRNGYATSAMRRRCRLCEVNPTAGPVLRHLSTRIE